jgi:hypothetical protein
MLFTGNIFFNKYACNYEAGGRFVYFFKKMLFRGLKKYAQEQNENWFRIFMSKLLFL